VFGFGITIEPDGDVIIKIEAAIAAIIANILVFLSTGLKV
jgi:hypothetical protein